MIIADYGFFSIGVSLTICTGALAQQTAERARVIGPLQYSNNKNTECQHRHILVGPQLVRSQWTCALPRLKEVRASASFPLSWGVWRIFKGWLRVARIEFLDRCAVYVVLEQGSFLRRHTKQRRACGSVSECV